MAAENGENGEDEETQVENVILSHQLDEDIDVEVATEEIEGVEPRDNWTGRVFYGATGTTLLWESGSLLVVGGATSEEDAVGIIDDVKQHLDEVDSLIEND